MNTQSTRILLVEDNDDHAELVLRALEDHEQAPSVTHVRDGAAALDYLLGRGAFEGAASCPPPDVVLLDLRLPRVDGLEVLRRIKTTKALQEVPVVVLTTSDAAKDLAQAYENHANAYVVKPVNAGDLDEMLRDAGSFWLGWNRRPHP